MFVFRPGAKDCKEKDHGTVTAEFQSTQVPYGEKIFLSPMYN